MNKRDLTSKGWTLNKEGFPVLTINQYKIEAVFTGEIFTRFIIYNGRKDILILNRVNNLKELYHWLWLTFGVKDD